MARQPLAVTAPIEPHLHPEGPHGARPSHPRPRALATQEALVASGAWFSLISEDILEDEFFVWTSRISVEPILPGRLPSIPRRHLRASLATSDSFLPHTYSQLIRFSASTPRRSLRIQRNFQDSSGHLRLSRARPSWKASLIPRRHLRASLATSTATSTISRHGLQLALMTLTSRMETSSQAHCQHAKGLLGPSWQFPSGVLSRPRSLARPPNRTRTHMARAPARTSHCRPLTANLVKIAQRTQRSGTRHWPGKAGSLHTSQSH
jgi:hypothetical protein